MQLFLLPLIFFIAIPLLFIKDNIGAVERLDPTIFMSLAALALISFIVIIGIKSLLGRLNLGKLFNLSIEVVFFYVLVAGFMFSVSVSTGMVDPEETPVNWLNMTLVFISVGLMLWIASGKHRQLLYLGVSLYVVFNISLSAFVIYAEFGSREDQKTLYRVSKDRNIFVVSLDGISGSAANEVLNQNPELASQFDGFKIFTNTAASSPATIASIVTSLYGNRNYKKDYKTIDEVWRSAPGNLITNRLQDNGFVVSPFGVYVKYFKARDQILKREVGPGLRASSLLEYTTARIFTKWAVSDYGFIAALEDRLGTNFNTLAENEAILLRKISSSKRNKWKKKFAATILEFDRYVQSLKVDSNKPSAHFLHFTFSHYPVEFDRSCEYMGTDSEWFKKRQNRFGAVEETYCTLGKFAEFIKKLKELGIFEQSMIILKTDHGKPVKYYDINTGLAGQINGHKRLGYGRYETFLAIKAYGTAQTPLERDSSPVMLDDLPLTICTENLGASLCDIYPGFNLLEEDLSIPDDATVTLFVVRDKNSTYKYETFEAVTVNRQPDIVSNLRKELVERAN